jgi:hypothetical protein
MIKINLNPYKDRIEQARERISRWHHRKPVDRAPFLFTPAGFQPPHTLGEQAEDQKKAVEVALHEIQFQLENFPDTDYVPFFKLPYLGEGIIPSMFGAEQYVVEHTPPFTKGRVLDSIGDLEKLPQKIDPEKDGWGPRLKEALEIFLDATQGEIPVGVVDHQSPYGIGTKILGNEELMLAMYDEPELVHRFLEICRQATEDVITAMEKWAGNPDLIVKNYRIPVKDGGIIIWDDYISVISPSLHKKFSVPVNNKLFDKYGKGHLHTCGPYYPGFIEAVLEHHASTIDTVITHGMVRLEEDYRMLKKDTSAVDIRLTGPLYLNDVHIHNKNHTKNPSREFLEEMGKDGGLFLTAGGTIEDGKELTEWVKKTF